MNKIMIARLAMPFGRASSPLKNKLYTDEKYCFLQNETKTGF
jgi:hypothetical protein